MKKKYICSVLIVLSMVLLGGCKNNKVADTDQGLKVFMNQVQNNGRVDKEELTTVIKKLNVDPETLNVEVCNNSKEREIIKYNYSNLPDDLQLNYEDALTLKLKVHNSNLIQSTKIKAILN